MNSPPSQQPIHSIDEARAAVLEVIPKCTETEHLPVLDAVGRILATNITARLDIPPFRNSAMDGYAIRFRDYQPDQAFEVIGTSLAGHPFLGAFKPRTAVKITTGAMVPPDADTIVILENTTRRNGSVTVERAPKLKEHIRNRGDDIEAGTLLIPDRTRLNPAQAGLASAQGITEVEVFRQPRIAIFSTGDELTAPGNELREAAIFDSNRTTISAVLKKAGFKSVDLGILKDNEREIKKLLKHLDDFDFVISSGGVSVGEADHMKSALEATGSLHFWKVAMKPGKPLVTGKLANDAFYFGLPGNPVSSMVTCVQFVIPALQSFCGYRYNKPKELRAICTTSLSKEPGRFEFQRGIYSIDDMGRLAVTTTGMQDSHVLHSMGIANCFICLQPECTGVTPGDEVNVILFDTLLGIAG